MAMREITISTVVGEDRRLVIDLPDEIPTGPVELTIRPAGANDRSTRRLTREAARAMLKAAGLLSSTRFASEEEHPLPPEEAERLAHLFTGSRPSEKLIDEDRGSY